ncbi:hypothetical protein PL9214720026 [Planktothrix tepida PCC 9214]|uniref:Uncharacterized protein n=1 Tax=Planktothrix tepida PCC 9214 TaxID=671072 RepID=A0A1J1LV56_9CYAN|nr:hypothetical protein PL9214720026 [Planktothrix tepida PCC 9214]
MKQIHGKKEVMLRNVQRIGNWALRGYLKNQFVVNDTIHLG